MNECAFVSGVAVVPQIAVVCNSSVKYSCCFRKIFALRKKFYLTFSKKKEKLISKIFAESSFFWYQLEIDTLYRKK